MKKFRWSASRFSNCVSKWVTLPDVTPGDSEGYRKAIRTIISKETVDWWIPVSHTSTAVVDSAIKKELEVTNPFVKVSEHLFYCYMSELIVMHRFYQLTM